MDKEWPQAVGRTGSQRPVHAEGMIFEWGLPTEAVAVAYDLQGCIFSCLQSPHRKYNVHWQAYCSVLASRCKSLCYGCNAAATATSGVRTSSASAEIPTDPL